ncbi:hypothetical protein [Agaribacterium haliotis]|uniref:hypothetical protein n=1 Tax=Agaribacterium haliotis TaxID=2013869 RepID=UPI000BB57E91|nr:hypothetical protein [Agaribacterium haliotis]
MDDQNLQVVIENFRQHLISGFETLQQAYDLSGNEVNFEEFYFDWAQSCWELLVERSVTGVNQSLQVYGSGSDYEMDAHSRVFFRSAKPTHEIVAFSDDIVIDCIDGDAVDLSKYELNCFVTMHKGWFENRPPYDCVLLDERGVYGSSYKQVVVKLSQIDWRLDKI